MSVSERVRLAQELHDGIAQDLVALGYALDSLVAVPETPNEIRAEMRSLRFAMSSLVDKVRAEIFSLRSQTDTLISHYESSTNIELQKIFAELLRNVQEHSQATSLTMTVHDNGVGGATQRSGHHGIPGITERVLNLEGCLEIESNELGTQVSITVPWKKP